ncbi:MAG: hypothetical protein K6F23_05985, partial [Solobacterium sp.]|nr:hypothetical protein [Solobacterium sp.]
NQYNFAGIRITLSFIFPKTSGYFKNKSYSLNHGIEQEAVCLKEEDLELMRREYQPEEWNSTGEMKMLAPVVSDVLIKYDRMIFHSVAFIMSGRTWLLAAPSGTGKTTQYMNLKELHPDIRIICGDNPVLWFKDKTIEVHPSPWNGKENMGSAQTGILYGIILLEQGQKNAIEILDKKEAVLPIMGQINTFMKTEETVHQVCRLEQRLLESVPVWKFRNTGTMESSEMLYRHLEDCGGAEDEL